ncbi:hypothetical protein M427DRAFT_334712 [Gonapodya prolifera JEL478]|uniref:Uncharacterized protein n=1 Tax=Gonapodya prolifera (strain JEL478) TaxID=1344416 RepID=A0A139AEF1_GONPJ|nr:hypothetical protein M427DRAFT_334712 [Gonapodya prolifera JEL478]|eukprot:KXS14803.1 hypothetical protein M427DRAFT_334712 [Gonapodya prolifera JEL478]
MILLILNHLAPHIFFLFGCLSRRYHHIVPRHFPPDGRVGIVVELVDKSNIVRFGSTGQRRERVLLDFFSRFRLAPAWNFVKGRKVVASLDLLIEHSLLSSNVDFGAIAAGMDELGNFTFAGVSKIGGLDGTAPLDWIISWLSKPISKPEKFSFGKQTALELLSIPRTLLFPGISHVDVSCGTTADVRQIHQTQQRGLFPSSQSIYIWSMSFQIANIRCLIHALTGMNSMSLKEVGIGFGIDEEQGRNYVFLIPQIVAAIPH